MACSCDAIWGACLLELLSTGAERLAIFLWHFAVTRDTPQLLAVLAALMLFEAVLLGWKPSSLGRLCAGSPSALADMRWFFLTHAGLIAALVYPVNLLAVAWFVPASREPFSLVWLFGPAGRILDYPVYWILFELAAYFVHRAAHNIPFLWAFHRVHHSATEFTVATTSRVHFGEVIFQTVMFGAFAGIVGLKPAEAALLWCLRTMLGYANHSNLDWDYGWLGRWLLVSPRAHALHHSTSAAASNANFGNVLIVWDRVFGTWRGGAEAGAKLGLRDNPYNTGVFMDDLMLPFREICARRTGADQAADGRAYGEPDIARSKIHASDGNPTALSFPAIVPPGQRSF